jgi:hypothetical protein
MANSIPPIDTSYANKNKQAVLFVSHKLVITNIQTYAL